MTAFHTPHPAISPELDRVVLTALKKKPGDRFPGTKEFRAALAAAAETAPQPVVHIPRRSRAVPLVFGILVVVAGLAVVSWIAMH